MFVLGRLLRPALAAIGVLSAEPTFGGDPSWQSLFQFAIGTGILMTIGLIPVMALARLGFGPNRPKAWVVGLIAAISACTLFRFVPYYTTVWDLVQLVTHSPYPDAWSVVVVSIVTGSVSGVFAAVVGRAVSHSRDM